jgi:hypothetical protein
VPASLLTYLTMDAHGDLLNAYERATSAREKLTADVEGPAAYRNSVSDGEGRSIDDRRLLARLREARGSREPLQAAYECMSARRAPSTGSPQVRKPVHLDVQVTACL